MDTNQLKSFTSLSKRQMLTQVLNVLMVVSSALMIWKGMGVLTNSESPIGCFLLIKVVVLSESMEPAFQRGDLLFLTLSSRKDLIGDITVFKIKDKDIPIVHRVLEVREDVKTGKQYVLTKGDNNNVDDRGLYYPGQMWLHKEDIIGRVVGYFD